MSEKKDRRLTEEDQTELFEDLFAQAAEPTEESSEISEAAPLPEPAAVAGEEEIVEADLFSEIKDAEEKPLSVGVEEAEDSSLGLQSAFEDSEPGLSEGVQEKEASSGPQAAESGSLDVQEAASGGGEGALPSDEDTGRVSDVVEAALANAEKDTDELTLAYFASRAYLEYAVSVVKGRALPDVSDGMKPVQRRILYAMKRMGLNPGTKEVKSARVVGDVLGKYHPHGDSAAYEAMVRLAQDFTMRYPLVHGHGNFGSADGDGAAAMRYTEVKLSRFAALLLDEIDQGTVKFIPNYDGAFKEPVLLPARLPMLLLNGASGIAVGMATEIPSHNLKEVAKAAVRLIKNPEASLEELLEDMPGPDFPGGAQIISSPAEIRSAYESGYGSLQLRASYHFEELSRGQWQLVIDEVPYKVSAQKVCAEIDALTNPKPAAGKRTLSARQQQDKQLLLNVISSIRDESSADSPIRLVIDPRSKSVDREELVNTLFSKTSLETSCKFNLVVIGIDGRPKQKGLKEILSEWTAFRLRTVLARSKTSLSEVLDRIHVLEGRLIILLDIEEAIRIIRAAEDPKKDLMEHFALSDEQAEDILEIKLRQLSGMDPIKLEKELEKHRKEEARLTELIENDAKLRKEVIKEIQEDSEKFGDERRTLIQEAETSALVQKVVDEPMTVIVSEKGFLRARVGHSVDVASLNYKLGDKLFKSFECRSVDYLYILSDTGRIYGVPVSQLPTGRGEGTHLSAFVQLQEGDRPFDYIAAQPAAQLLFSSDDGFGFFCCVRDLAVRQRSGKTFFTLSENAKPLPIRVVTPLTGWIAALSSAGRACVFAASEMRALSSGGKGVTIMNLGPQEKLVAAAPISPNGFVVCGIGRGNKPQELVIGPRLVENYRTKRARKGKAVEASWVFTDVLAYKPEKVVGETEGTGPELV